jgi:ATP-binding cassette, subfamily B, multidrug efflux pump
MPPSGAGPGVSPLRRLLPYFGRHRRTLGIGLGCILATTAIQLLAPWVLKFAVDDLQHGVTRGKLGYYAALLFGIATVGGLFRYLMRRIIIGVSREMEHDLRNDFFAHLERLPPQYFRTHRTGDLMSRATNDLNAVRMMIGPAIMYSAQTVLVFAVAIVLMMSIDLRLTLVALIPLPFVSLAVRYFGSAIHRRFEAIQAQLSEVSAVVQEALSGVRVVRAYRQEAHEVARFRKANEEYLRRNRVLIRLQGAFYPSMTFFLGLGSLLVLWRGHMTLGEFVAFNGYLVMLSWPMIAFGWVTNILQRGFASWGRMLQVLDEAVAISDATVTDRGRAAADVFATGAIDVRNLTFTYPGAAAPALSDVSLRIEPGQTAAFVGATGSGKSTLISLLPRLHEPPAGTVTIGGVDVREIPLERLRGAIGFVPQEPFLFSDTIAENVAFGGGKDTKEARDTKERIAAAAHIARLDKDIADFPRGYETTVGERGITLSGGQKQRTALARAIMVDPRILILDDALSAVDTYTEEEILSGLRGVMRQRTSIIVSHRISTVRGADQIFVLKDGRIVERGTHDQLVTRDGVYAGMYRKQLLEEELQAS